MADFKLKVSSKDIQNLKNELKRTLRRPIDTATARKVGGVTVSSMKSLVSKGRSPIKGKGKFEKYKKSYIPTRRKFVRPTSPPDLKLSGSFLRNLTYKIVNGETAVGFFDKLSRAKERGHREGANKQGKRPIVPQGRENFVKSITDKIEKIYINRLQRVLKQID